MKTFHSMILAAFALSVAFAPPKVEEKVVGRAAPRSESYFVSPKGVHYAVLTPKGTRNVLVVDGVEGPEFDMFLNRRGHAGTISNNGVVFSPDGAHYAYYGGLGNQYIFVLDGKEIARGELGPSNLGYSDMAFSPGGKHVYFVDLKPSGPSGNARAQLIMDGKAGPPSGHQNIFPVFSPDESRWAYNAVKFGGRPDEFISVVDGKEVPFIGYSPFFTADNKLITSMQSKATDPAVVNIDGKAAAPGVSTGGKMGAAPVGSRWAGVVQPKKAGDVSVLYIDGKAVTEAQNVQEVIFSPDGKHYMAIGRNNTTRANYVVLDGKKGPDYQTIVPNMTRFSADSSRAIYIGNNAGKNFVVVDGQPSEGYLILMGTNKIVMSAKGGHYGYLASDGVNQVLVIDGKSVPLEGRAALQDSLGFSTDGSRYAYLATRPRMPARILVVDGVETPNIAVNDLGVPQLMQNWWYDEQGPQAKYFAFSPDGKHIVFSGMRTGEMRYSVFVDGKSVFTLPVSRGVSFMSWSPDSRHVFWISDEALGVNASSRVMVDGKPSPVKFGPVQPTAPGIWQVGADGVLQFLAFDGADAKRYRITPGNDTSVDTMLAAAK